MRTQTHHAGSAMLAISALRLSRPMPTGTSSNFNLAALGSTDFLAGFLPVDARFDMVRLRFGECEAKGKKNGLKEKMRATSRTAAPC